MLNLQLTRTALEIKVQMVRHDRILLNTVSLMDDRTLNTVPYRTTLGTMFSVQAVRDISIT